MTNEFAIKVLTELRGYGDKFANIGFDRKEALDMAIKALEQQSRDCKTCKHSDNGNCAGTEECHECMWESKYEQQTCDDCISREAVEKITWDEPYSRDYLNVLTELRDRVRALPSVQPTRPKGKWIIGEYETWVCSACGERPLNYTGFIPTKEQMKERWHFCSVCGADMRESETE